MCQWHLQTVKRHCEGRPYLFLITANIPASRVVVWSWLNTSSSSRSLDEATILAASSRGTVVTFGNSSQGSVDSSNLFATPREAAAKFSAVCLPLKRRVSKALLHSAHSRSRNWAGCVANDWVTRSLPIVGERHTNSCLRSQETFHFLLGTLMSVSGT